MERNTCSFSTMFIVLLYLCAFSLSAESSHAESSHAESSHEEVLMATMDILPYGFLSPEGQKIGALYDILNEVILESGIGRVNQLIPPVRIITYMLENKKVCTILADVPSVAPNFDLIEPIGHVVTVGILPKAGLTVTDYSDLKPLVIAVPLGVRFDDKFHNDTTLSKVFPPQYINAIRMIKAGRIDAIAGALGSLNYIAKAEGLTARDFARPLIFQKNSLYLVCTNGLSKNVRNKLKETVINLKKNKKIKSILKQYFGDN